MIWNKEIECAKRQEINDMQLERMKALVKYCYENVPLYKKKFDDIGLKPEHIATLSDVEKIPYTTKEDMRDNYPYGLFAKPLKEIVRIHASTGTTGKPTLVGYTKNDMKSWMECIARIVCAAGVTEDDIAQVLFGYGLFTGGFGLHYGLEHVGAAVIPSSSGNSERQLMLMEDCQTTAMISTPSYALYLYEIAERMNLNFKNIKLRVGLFGGEGHTPEMRREIESRWGILATENYGLSEVMGPGVSGECEHQDGMHICEDYFYLEIVNAETGEVLREHEKGEVIISTLTKEGIPLLRYRTRDISFLNFTPCKCGRTSARMNKIFGRNDDMLIIRGVNVFPSQIESVLVGMEYINPHYNILVTKQGYMDKIELHVELADASLLDSFSAIKDLEQKILQKLRTVLQIDAKIKFVAPNTIERTAGKSKRVIDLRDKQ